jgi:hypothetical protein
MRSTSAKQVYWRNPQLSIKASVFIATSLDGFIARANGELDWLTGAQGTSTEQDYGYQEFMDTVDTIVLGRNTFELVLTFDTWPYSGKKVVVLSSKPNAILPHLVDKIEWLSLPTMLGSRILRRGSTRAGSYKANTASRIPCDDASRAIPETRGYGCEYC